ncbi:NINE protein [Mucilaginibacter sp.]|uniref:NINE protein n=1 Tax=Mucilaginibacter sp. TaxID=1882438 RepID=UPI0025F5B866|nr:NINE protein [Mucilaginibacter sp.]
MKSKSTAYILWFFFGVIGVHKFYLNKTGMGILYFFTLGLFGIGWIIDLFTLGSQVDTYNALFGRTFSANNNINNIVVNVPASHGVKDQPGISEQLHKLYELKEKGILNEEEYNIQKSKVLA